MLKILVKLLSHFLQYIQREKFFSSHLNRRVYRREQKTYCSWVVEHISLSVQPLYSAARPEKNVMCNLSSNGCYYSVKPHIFILPTFFCTLYYTHELLWFCWCNKCMLKLIYTLSNKLRQCFKIIPKSLITDEASYGYFPLLKVVFEFSASYISLKWDLFGRFSNTMNCLLSSPAAYFISFSKRKEM